MPNIFDQFDAAPAAPASTNVFDQFDQPATATATPAAPPEPAKIKLDPYDAAKLAGVQDPMANTTDFETAVARDPVGFVKSLPNAAFTLAAAPGKLAYLGAADALAKATGDKEYGGNLAAMEKGGEQLPAEKFIASVAKTNPKLALTADLGEALPEFVSMMMLNPTGTIGKLIAAGFSAQMVMGVKEQATQLGAELGKPAEDQDAGKIAALKAGLIQTGIFAPLAAGHAASGVPAGTLNPKLRAGAILDAFKPVQPAPKAAPTYTPPPRPPEVQAQIDEAKAERAAAQARPGKPAPTPPEPPPAAPTPPPARPFLPYPVMTPFGPGTVQGEQHGGDLLDVKLDNGESRLIQAGDVKRTPATPPTTPTTPPETKPPVVPGAPAPKPIMNWPSKRVDSGEFKLGDRVAFSGTFDMNRGTIVKLPDGRIAVHTDKGFDAPLHDAWKPDAEVPEPSAAGPDPWDEKTLDGIVEGKLHYAPPELVKRSLDAINRLRANLAKRNLNPNHYTAQGTKEIDLQSSITGTLHRLVNRELAIQKQYKRANPAQRAEAEKNLNELLQRADDLLAGRPPKELTFDPNAQEPPEPPELTETEAISPAKPANADNPPANAGKPAANAGTEGTEATEGTEETPPVEQNVPQPPVPDKVPKPEPPEAPEAPTDALFDRITQRYRELLPSMSVANIKKMAGMLHKAISEGLWTDLLRPENKNTRKLFEELTGVKLPLYLRDTQALFTGKPFPVIDKTPKPPQIEPPSHEQPSTIQPAVEGDHQPPTSSEGEPPRPAGGGGVAGEQPQTGDEVGGGRKPADAGTGGGGTSGGGAGPRTGGGGQPPSPPRDLRTPRRTPADTVTGKNYVITDADHIGEGSLATKKADNMAALRLVKKLEAEKRLPTVAEQAVLARYVGWGGLKGMFVEGAKGFEKEAAELKTLLTPEEYDAARASIQDAHYTSPTVIQRGIYAAMKRFGFTGGKMVEGGVGIGNFIGLMPDEMRGKSSYIGVERDPITAKIAQYLYPEARIMAMGYQDAKLTRNHFDGAVGNPPFGDKAIYDKNHKESSKFSIHNYFIAKTLELMRPGATAGFVVSRYFLDTLNPAAREYIASLGEFLGAIRLPNTAFLENANTEVVTDLVFFKRRATPPADVQEDWTKTTDHKDPVSGFNWPLNKWIHEHPDMVMGTIAQAEHGLYGDKEMTVNPLAEPLGDSLDKAVAKLPENVYEENSHADTERLNTDGDVTIPQGTKPGNFFEGKDGRLLRRLDDVDGKPVSVPVEMKEATMKRVKAMIPIRDALNRQIKLEQSPDAKESDIEVNRKVLNTLYDQFVKKFGFLNTPTNRRAFYEDNDVFRLLGLESEYQPGISEETAKKHGVDPIKPTAKKADIFTKRVNAPHREVTSVGTAKEAMAVSMNQRGLVDADYMAQLTGQDVDTVLKELGDLVYKDPAGGYKTREQYLSGNVRAALNEARAAGPEYQRNVEALEKVIPKDIDPVDIKAPVGAPWVDAKDVAKFAEELTGSAPRAVAYMKANAGWLFEHRDRSTASTQTWGTPDMPFGELFKAMLNGKSIVVYDEVPDGHGGTMRVVLPKETTLAQAKAEEIKQKWAQWLWLDRERRERLHRVYNDNYNNYVEATSDGSHLTLPGMSTQRELRPHQKNVVWRTITSGGKGLLYDHVVGAGKTYAGVASMMELRRLGRVRKWMVTVPNHLTGQWADAFKELYPNCNILAAKASDFNKQNRQRFFAKVLTGNFDAVVVGHSSLKKVGTSPEVEKGILKEMMQEIIDTIKAMKEAEGNRKRGSRQLSQMEKAKDRIQAKLDKLADISGRDTTANFDELGFDGMFVDEAHEFKNLYYTTQMQNVAGLGNANGSAKAFDLHLKTRFLKNQYGGKAPIVFATGTPISNSLVEMFTLQRFLQPEVLEQMGLKTLDAWARVFAEIEPVYEVDPTGTGMRMATRFKNFQNVGELTGVYKTMADVISANDLQAQAAMQGKRFPVPKMLGGKPNNIVAPRTPEQAAYFGVEKEEVDEEGNPRLDTDGNPITSYPEGTINWRVDNMPNDPREDNMLKLTNDARKAGLDMRLIHPSASDRPETKINRAVAEIAKVWKDWTPKKGTQLVFCDLSIPASHKNRLLNTEHDVFYRDQDGDLKPGKATLTIIGDTSFNIVHIKGKDAANSGYIAYEATTGTHTRIFDHNKKAVVDTLKARMKQPDAQEWLSDLVADASPITPDEIEAYNDEHEEENEVEDATTVDELLAMHSDFSVYDDMKAKLIKAGVPERDIAFIHDYDTPEKKMKLFRAVKAGEIRILFGSTAKMGAGMNVQDRIVALHHMDAPWRPSDLEQREGRAIRQGNLFYDENIKQYKNPHDYDTDPKAFAVAVYRYGTDLSYDTRMWQIIEHKASGIEGFRRADRSTRTIEDVGGEAANASDMKAATSGNPLIAKEIRLRTEKKKLELLRDAYTKNLIALQQRADYLRGGEMRYQSKVKAAQQQIDIRDANTKRDDKGKVVFEFTMPDNKITAEKGVPVAAMVKEIQNGDGMGYFGKYRGFHFWYQPWRDSSGRNLDLIPSVEKAKPKSNDYATRFKGDDQISGVGLFTRLDNWLADMERAISWAEETRKADAKTLAEVEQSMKNGFPKQAELNQVTAEHAEVQGQLMSKKKKPQAGPTAPPKPPDDDGPTQPRFGQGGPGSAAAGEPGSYSPIQHMADEMSMGGRGKPVDEQIRLIDKLKARAGDVKDSLKRTLAGLVAIKNAMWDKYKSLPTYGDEQQAVGRWTYALQKADAEARNFAKQITKAVPNKLRREAITNYLQCGGDDAKLQHRANASGGTIRQGYQIAMNLTQREKEIAGMIRDYYDVQLQNGIEAGILKDGLDDYITQVWKRPNPATHKMVNDLVSAKLQPNFRFARQRMMESFFEGEQMGYTPEKDAGLLVAMYDQAFNKTLAARAFIKDLHEGKASDGNPLTELEGIGYLVDDGDQSRVMVKPYIQPAALKGLGYKAIDHPALKGWKFVTKGPDATPVIQKGRMLVHPEAYEKLKNRLASSKFQQFGPARALLKVQREIKQTMLSFSGFHQVQETLHALGHRVNPINMPAIDFTEPVTKALAEHGLQLANYDALADFSEGLTGGGLLTKVPLLGPKLHAYNQFLFQDHIPRLKLAMAKAALERNRKAYPKLGEDQVLELTASQANAAFGELPYKYWGRSPTMQDAMRTFLLAPDFLEARARFVGRAFMPHGREQLIALGLIAATQYITARILNQILDDDPHWELKNSFRLVVGKHAYQLRTVPGDLLHLFTDTRSFAYSRFSPLMRTAAEYITKRDINDVKRDTLDQIKDALKLPVPISMKTNLGQSWWNEFCTSLGVQTQRYDAIQTIQSKAAAYKAAHGIGSPVDFSYDMEKDKFAALRLAIENDQEGRAREEYAKLLKTVPAAKIQQHFKLSLSHPFTGSTAGDAAFYKSLDAAGKREFQEAKDLRAARLAMVRALQ